MTHWDEYSIGDMVDIKHGFAFKGEFIVDEPTAYVLLSPGNFAIGGGFKEGKLKYYKGEVPTEFVLAEGDLLVTMTDLSRTSDTLGYPALVPHRADGRRYLHNQRLGKILPRPRVEIDLRYLHYLMCSDTYRQEVVASATGTTVKHTSPSRIQKYRFLRPPIREQVEIGRVLGTLDEKIEMNRRMSQTLEAIAQAIFKSWFVDFEPVRAKAGGESPESIGQRLGLSSAHMALFPDSLVETDIGPAPKGWQPVTLKDLTTKIGSGATPRGGGEVYVDEGVALIRSQNVYDSEFVWDGLVRLTDEAAKQLANVVVQPNDVLINITGASILRTCVVPAEILPARVNQHVAIIRARECVSARYLHLHLLRPDTKATLLGLNAGASREAVTKAHLESVKLLDPGIELLKRFDEAVSAIYAQVACNAVQARILGMTRDTLLPKLLNGELQVVDGDDA
jgi:type I restriction enzyme, S subunit